MKKLIIIFAVIVVVFVVYILWKKPLVAPTIEESTSSEPLTSPVAAPAATPVTSLENENIKVTSPMKDVVLKSPFVVAGEARVFENVVSIRVTNAKGEPMIQETAYAKSPDAGQFGPFSINISYSFKNTKEGFVEVYSASPKDGSDQDVVRIPVTFQ